MKILYEKWWIKENKVFQVIDYKKPWREYNNKPRLSFRTNGAWKRRYDTCLDITLTIGYIVVNYTDYDFRKRRS